MDPRDTETLARLGRYIEGNGPYFELVAVLRFAEDPKAIAQVQIDEEAFYFYTKEGKSAAETEIYNRLGSSPLTEKLMGHP